MEGMNLLRVLTQHKCICFSPIFAFNNFPLISFLFALLLNVGSS
jgi:hypothetical protein